MKIILLLCLLTVGAQAEQRISEMLAPLMESKDLRAEAVEIIPKSRKAEALQYLKEVYKNKENPNSTAAGILLVNLNDEEHIQTIIADYRSDEYTTYRQAAPILGLSSQIKVIPSLVDLVYEEEPKIDVSYGDQWDMCKSIRCSQVILSILSRSPMVSEKVHQWAGDNRKGFGLAATSCRDVVRKWWPQNKQFFESGEYGKIRPLMDEASTETANPTVPVEKDAAITNQVSEPGEQPQTMPVKQSKSAFPWAISGLAVVLVLIWAGMRFVRK